MEKLRSKQLEIAGEFATLEAVTPEEFMELLLKIGIKFKGSIQLVGLTKEQLDAQFE